MTKLTKTQNDHIEKMRNDYDVETFLDARVLVDELADFLEIAFVVEENFEDGTVSRDDVMNAMNALVKASEYLKECY